MKLTEILNEVKEDKKYPPYIYSEDGFGCHVCKFYYFKKDKHMCGNEGYKKYKGTDELVDKDGNQIKDPSKWCSNWFLPRKKSDEKSN